MPLQGPRLIKSSLHHSRRLDLDARLLTRLRDHGSERECFV